MLVELLKRWPLLRQIATGADGTGPEAMTEHTRNLQPRILDCDETRSICPYCGVGCGQIVYHKQNQIINIEGDPESPVSRGRLCPKGANTRELHTHSGRLTRIRYRRPYSRKWESLDLEAAMEMIAERLWGSRERSFVEERDGQPVMHTTAVAHLGGATLDIEENYLIKKLFTGGLGMVCLSNQARI